jgi:glycosyltransferase involved in cell wall biosynthesis
MRCDEPGGSQEQTVTGRVAAPPALVIATILRPEGGTGVHSHVRELRAYLDEREIPSTLVTPFSRMPLLSAPVFAVRLALKHVSGTASIFWYRYFHQKFLGLALRKHLKSLDEAVIYAQGPVEAEAALLARTNPRQRVIMAIHFEHTQADEWVRSGEISINSAMYRAIQGLEERMEKQVDGILFVSDAARRDFLNSSPDAHGRLSAAVPNFVRPVPGRLQEIRGDLVTVGSLDINKNHRFLLQVLAEARRMGSPLTLDVYGDGRCRKELERLASSLELNEYVRFHGFRPDVRENLPAYRVYVHSSYSEALPFAIIEAMAAGLPIVATSAGGIPELCRDGIEGRLWSLDDPRQGAATLLDLMANEAVRSAAGAASLQRYRSNFHPAVVGPQLYAFLTQSTAPRSNSRDADLPTSGELPTESLSIAPPDGLFTLKTAGPGLLSS